MRVQEIRAVLLLNELFQVVADAVRKHQAFERAFWCDLENKVTV
jgi:hypothetical protein